MQMLIEEARAVLQLIQEFQTLEDCPWSVVSVPPGQLAKQRTNKLEKEDLKLGQKKSVEKVSATKKKPKESDLSKNSC